MTPRELLYDVPVERESHCFYLLSQFVDEVDFFEIVPEESDRITIKDIKYVDFDGSRIWHLATVWFDKQPVMITQKGGRGGGGDHQKRFVVDVRAYREMVTFLASLPREQDAPEILDWIDMDTDKPELTEFYSNTLEQMQEEYPPR